MFNTDYDFNSQDFVNKEKTKKKQIILCHTSCTISQYLKKITTRDNKKYDKIPHFTIDLAGNVYSHIDPQFTSNFIGVETIDKDSIIVILENVGWLNYNVEQTRFFDWMGNEYFGKKVEKLWRNKRYWAEYTEDQILSLITLLNYLCEEYSITKDFTGNNITITKPRSFKGILNRSNYNKNYYDLSPAMDFEIITNNVK